MQAKKSTKKLRLLQLYTFDFITKVGGIFYSFFYSVFLYRSFFDVRFLIVEHLVAALSTWAGFLLASFWIRKHGYVRVAKISFLLFAINSVATILYIDYIQQIYIPLGFARGLAAGALLAVAQSYLLKEIKKTDRSRYFYLIQSMELVIGIVMPVFIGFIITSAGGYKVTFGISAAIYLAGVITPFRHNFAPQGQISFKKCSQIFKHKVFKEYSYNRILAAGADGLNGFVVGIVPFILLENEFDVGVLAGATGLLAALISYFSRNTKIKKQIFMGYAGSFARLFLNSVLALFWSVPALVIRNIAMGTATVFTDPVTQNTDMKNRERILGKAIKNSALEMNIIDQTFHLLGKIIALMPFLFIFIFFMEDQGIVLRFMLVIYAVWKVVGFVWILHINNKLVYRKPDKDALAL